MFLEIPLGVNLLGMVVTFFILWVDQRARGQKPTWLQITVLSAVWWAYWPITISAAIAYSIFKSERPIAYTVAFAVICLFIIKGIALL